MIGRKVMRKAMSFRLDFQTIDMLDALVQLVYERNKSESSNGYAVKLNRTHILHVAIGRMFAQEQKAKRRR